jgi:hypothetical protein
VPAIPSLLLVDVLGVKARWVRGGAEEAVSAFEQLADLVAAEMASAPKAILGAEVESDMAVIASTSTNAALQFAKSLYLRAFVSRTAVQERSERLWLRGVLLPRPARLSLSRMRVRQIHGDDRVVVVHLAEPLLEAISSEKAGYKGMRLVVHPQLVTRLVQAAAAVERPSGGSANTLVQLTNRPYPQRLRGFHDFLWMATPDRDEWRSRSDRMVRRLRYAVHDDEEVAQAAGTQIVFDECERVLRTRIVPRRLTGPKST